MALKSLFHRSHRHSCVLREDSTGHLLVLVPNTLSLLLFLEEVKAIFPQDSLFVDEEFRWHLNVCFPTACEPSTVTNKLRLRQWGLTLN